MKITQSAQSGIGVTPAWSVTVSDPGGYFTDDDLEDILQEIGAGTLTGYLTVIGGGKGTVQALGTLGATETIDLANGNLFWGTLDQDCTIDTVGWTNLKDCQITVILFEDGTGGWTPTFSGVTWDGDGTVPVHGTTPGTFTRYVFTSYDGGTTIIGAKTGSGTTAPLLIVQEVDGSPAVAATEIDVSNGGLTVAGTVATLHLLTSRGGERADVQTIAASGASQTLDLSLYNTFDITLTANCTLTFSNPPASGVDAHWVIVLRQGGAGSFTVTWPGTVDWQDTDGTSGGSAPTLWTAVGAQDGVDISTTDGGTSYGGTFKTHPVSSYTLTVEDDGTPLATGATTLDFAGNGVTVTGAGTEKTVTIPGGATASDTGIWRPLLDSATGAVIQDGATGEATMGFGAA